MSPAKPRSERKTAKASEAASSLERLDRDEKVKIDLPFETAMRALLEVPPPESEEPPAGTPRER